MKTATAALVAVLVLTSTAIADNPANWLPNWNRPTQKSPPVPTPVPPPSPRAKPEALPAPSAESPRVQPRSVERAKPKPKITIIERSPVRPEVVKPKQKVVDDGPGLPWFVSCALVCQYARDGGGAQHSANASPRQIREGLACVKRDCPQYLRK